MDIPLRLSPSNRKSSDYGSLTPAGGDINEQPSYFGDYGATNNTVATPFNGNGPPTVAPSKGSTSSNFGFAAALFNNGQHHPHLSPVPSVHPSSSNRPREVAPKPKRPSGLSAFPQAPPSPAVSTRPESESPISDLRSLSFKGRSESPQQMATIPAAPQSAFPLHSPALRQHSMFNLSAPTPSHVPLKRHLPAPSKASTIPASAQNKNKNARVTADKFVAASKTELDGILSKPDAESTVLIVDIRPHTKFSSSEQGHLSHAISLCAPTTLLRRAAFGLDRLAETLPDASEKARFLSSVSSDSPINTILAVDQDSTALFDDSPLCSLLTKFEKAGFEGRLQWVHGGYQSLQSDRDFMDRHRSPTDSAEPTDLDSLSSSPSHSSISSRVWPNSRTNSSGSSSGSASSLVSSFAGLSERSGSFSDASCSLPQVRLLPGQAFDSRSTQAHKLGQTKHQGFQQQCANPFFDTIRQNHEALSLESSMSNVCDVHLRPDCDNPHFARQLPACLKDLVDKTPRQRGEKLAHEFYQVEAAEQKRLQDVLDWSSRSGQAAEEEQHPFSIAAGMEKGHLNRYKNIFPYEQARCHLQEFASGATDYINASHVRFKDHPDKSYIASQGPLPSTYEDFWQLIDQENVPVVVMLTNLVEGGREKCGKYYLPGQYGRFQVTCADGSVNQYPGEGSTPSKQQTSAGGFFSSFDSAAVEKKTPRVANSPSVPVCRSTLTLTKGDGRSRVVRHIKFAGWPDFDVPPDAEALLDLISEVNQAKEDIAKMNGTGAGPVLVHCSAGVGRTGSYMLVDVLLDMYAKARKQQQQAAARGMDVDRNLQESSSQYAAVLNQEDYLRQIVDEMRQHRMSMVANYAQYQFCSQAILIGCQRIANQDL